MKAGSGIGDRILLEDNHLILVNKLPGEIVQGDKTGDEPLSDLVKRYLKDKYKKPGDAFLGTVHRIDRPVSGVVIYAKTSKALERMNALLRERKLGKTYWAVTGSPPEGEGRLSGWLRKNQQRNKSYVVDEKTKGALFAELEWKQQATSDRYMMLLVHPLTGRHHQIRVLLAHAGAVIRGDLKYGARRSNPDGSIHLHAREVRFLHPVRNEEIRVVAPVPGDSLWKYFEGLESDK